MKRVVFFLGMVWICTTGSLLAQTCLNAVGVLQVNPAALIFGNVAVGSSQTLTLTIINSSVTSDMSVTKLDTLNGRYQFKNAPHTPFCLTPGKSVSVDVVFTPQQQGLVVSHLQIVSTGGKVNVPTSGTGTGGGGGVSLKTSPSSLNFGSVQVGQSSKMTLAILNAGSSQATVDKVSSSNGAFSVSSPSFPKTISAGGQLIVTVAFAPSKSGSFSGTLSIFSGGAVAASANLAGEGSSGSPHISISPSQLDFGTQDVGTFNTLPVTVSNTGNATLEVSIPGDSLVMVSPAGTVDISPGKSAQFSVKLIADAQGSIGKSLKVLSNDPDSPKVDLNLKATGVPGKFGFVNRTTRSGIAGNPNRTSALQYVDFDGDGKTDLYLTGHDGNLMCKNKGGARFGDSTGSSNLGNNGEDSRGVTWGDVDNDGDLDVFISNFNAPSVFLQNQGNVFSAPGGVAPGLYAEDATTNATGSLFFDFNNDSRLDIFVIKDGQANQLFKGLGAVQFANIASQAGVAFKGPGRSAVAADFNGDGFQDLYVANFKRPNKLFLNNKNETFRDITAAAGVGFSGASEQVVAVDYDGDEDIDIFVVNSQGSCVLYRNQGNLKFQNVTAAAGLTLPTKARSANWGDFDKDGDLDVIVAQSGGDNLLFSNNGDGKFTRITNVDLSNADDPSSTASSDSDNDGDTDVAVGDEDGGGNSGDSVYQNTGGAGNNFLIVTLQGTVSNRSAIGAKVLLKMGALLQVQVVSGGDGKNQSSLPLEFGIGDAKSVILFISWPSGKTQGLDNVAANQKIKIVEPAN